MTTWHTYETAAKHVKFSVRYLQDAVKRGDVPAFGGTKGIRFKESDLDAWLESQPWEPKAASA